MQRFANWANLAETTFLLTPTRPGADYRVRIFTPSRELPFAGHPTLGSAHAWSRARGDAEPDSIVQECGAGLISLRRIDGRLAFAAPPLLRGGPLDAVTLAEVTATLGIDPSGCWAPDVCTRPTSRVRAARSGAAVASMSSEIPRERSGSAVRPTPASPGR
jgi:predicted PhzF superfamily epimerase YddE/YHI9